MTVRELKNALNEYNDNAEVIIVNWTSGWSFDPSIGSDDENEGETYCRIGF